PGGTANVMSFELGIPRDLAAACALIDDQASVTRAVDMGQVRGDGGRHFLLRVGIGFEAEMVEGADRSRKEKLGTLAYGLAALQALREPPIARYTVTLDGREISTEGITCIVANSGSFGRSGLTLAPAIDVGDGLLDVIVIRKGDLASLLSVAASVLTSQQTAEPLQRWQAREVTVVAKPPQPVTVDGEMAGETPITARVIPQAVRVIVPTESGATPRQRVVTR
ncbi:MAG: diacylglycerol/lipid kinase family protein, partial [Chloroflexota bacterium]